MQRVVTTAYDMFDEILSFYSFLITHYGLDTVIRCWSRCRNYGYRYRSGKATQVNISSNKIFMCCLVGLKISALEVPFFLICYLKFYYSGVEIIATIDLDKGTIQEGTPSEMDVWILMIHSKFK